MMRKELCIVLTLMLVCASANATMYLYKKTDVLGNTRGLLTCSTPQPAREGLVEIDKAEFDAIQAQAKAAEMAEFESAENTKEKLEAKIEALEARIKKLEDK